MKMSEWERNVALLMTERHRHLAVDSLFHCPYTYAPIAASHRAVSLRDLHLDGNKSD
jgi:hypothetical protein